MDKMISEGFNPDLCRTDSRVAERSVMRWAVTIPVQHHVIFMIPLS